jgi:hypothetical protein
MSSIAYKLAHGRLLVIDEAADELMLDHEMANMAHDVEYIVKETIQLSEVIKRFVVGPANGLRPNTTKPEIVRAHQCGFLMNKMLDLLSKVESLAAEMGRFGRFVEGRGVLHTIRQEIDANRAEFAKKWLLPDEKNIRTSKEELAKGDYITL